MFGTLGRVLRRLSVPWGVRGMFSQSCEFMTPEMAMLQLNRKMRGVLKRLRENQKGYLKPSRVRYNAKLKAARQKSYRKIQNVIAHIELEQALSAHRKKCDRAREKKIEDDPYYDAILNGRVPPEL